MGKSELEKFNIVLSKIAIFALVVYAAIMFFIYIKYKSYVPDEIWFYAYLNMYHNYIMKGNIFDIPNSLGYGQLYWIFYSIINNMLLIRIISIVCVFGTIYFIFKTTSLFYSGSNIKVVSSLVIMLYLTFPISWFTGKIIGPEIISTTFGAAACYFYFLSSKTEDRKFYLISIILLSMSCSIKLSNVVFGVLIGCYIIINVIESSKDAVYQIGMGTFIFVTSFIIFNPFIITDFSQYKTNLTSTIGSFNLSYIESVLFQDVLTWDLIGTGGINYHVILVVFLVVIMLLFGIINLKKSIPFIMTIIFIIISCCKSPFFSWYLMPLIYIIPVLVSIGLSNVETLNFKYIGIVVAIIIINFFCMFENIYYNVNSKFDQFSIVDNEQYYIQIIDDFFKQNTQFDYNTSMYLTEFGFSKYSAGLFDISKLKENQVLIIMDRFLNIDDRNDLVNSAKENMGEFALIQETNGVYFLTKKKVQ